jgi:hypothetical protein
MAAATAAKDVGTYGTRASAKNLEVARAATERNEASR